ncbi:dioxygenase [Neisseria sp. Ec49-e6-T10]|uniref:dioxygenase n=1 Tax=Neisseria sp. Ec49-e6-T10 TaxID=3140744 RepID=UPI003EC0A263
MSERNDFLDIMYNESSEVVKFTLEFWLYECEISESPPVAEVRQWRDILAKRGGKFEKYAHFCQQWLEEEASDA